MSFVASPGQLLLLKPFCFFPPREFYEVSSPIPSTDANWKDFIYVVLLVDDSSMYVSVVCVGVQFNLIFLTAFIHNYGIKSLSPF